MIQIDMPMPEACWGCRFMVYNEGRGEIWCSARENGADEWYDEEDDARWDALYEKCPLIEVKTGHWIKIGRWGRHFKCSNCGNTLDFSGVNAGRGDANCCPNCGSRNEVKDNGND